MYIICNVTYVTLHYLLHCILGTFFQDHAEHIDILKNLELR